MNPGRCFVCPSILPGSRRVCEGVNVCDRAERGAAVGRRRSEDGGPVAPTLPSFLHWTLTLILFPLFLFLSRFPFGRARLPSIRPLFWVERERQREVGDRALGLNGNGGRDCLAPLSTCAYHASLLSWAGLTDSDTCVSTLLTYMNCK